MVQRTYLVVAQCTSGQATDDRMAVDLVGGVITADLISQLDDDLAVRRTASGDSIEQADTGLTTDSNRCCCTVELSTLGVSCNDPVFQLVGSTGVHDQK